MFPSGIVETDRETRNPDVGVSDPSQRHTIVEFLLDGHDPQFDSIWKYKLTIFKLMSYWLTKTLFVGNNEDGACVSYLMKGRFVLCFNLLQSGQCVSAPPSLSRIIKNALNACNATPMQF